MNFFFFTRANKFKPVLDCTIKKRSKVYTAVFVVYAGTLRTCLAHFSRPSHRVFFKILADYFPDMITLHGYFFSASRRLFFKSNGVLCFQGSRNCKKELNYADGQTKSIVPVMCEKGFKAQGWLGIITAGLLWIDFRYIDKYFASFCSTSAVSN